MEMTLTVWTVISGDEDGESLVDLNLSQTRARRAFDEQMAQLPDRAAIRHSDDGPLSAHVGLEWVRLESRPMQISMRELIQLIAEAEEATGEPATDAA